MNMMTAMRRDLQTTGAVGLALLLLLFSVMVNRYRFDFIPLRPHAEHLATALGFLLFAFLLWRKRARLTLLASDALLIAYLTVALGASFLFPDRPGESVQYWTRMASAVAIYFLVRWLLTAADGAAAFRLAVKALLIFGVLEAGFGIVGWLLYPFGMNLGVDEYPLGLRGPGGVLCNFSLTTYGTLWEPNVFGSVLMAIILIGATLFVSNEFAAWRKPLGAALLVMLTALALNASRAALGTLAFGLVLILLFAQGMALRQKIRWAIAAAGILLVVMLPSPEISRVLMQMPNAPGLASRAPCAAWIAAGMPTSMLSDNPDDFKGIDAETGSGAGAVRRLLEGQTLSSRWVTYERAWHAFLQRPLFGNGADAFGQEFTTTAHTPGWISNMFLMSLHDTGIVGTLLLLAWLVWYVRTIFNAWRRAPTGALRTMVFALGIGAIGLMIAYQATTMLWFGFIWWYFAILAQGALVIETRNV